MVKYWNSFECLPYRYSLNRWTGKKMQLLNSSLNAFRATTDLFCTVVPNKFVNWTKNIDKPFRPCILNRSRKKTLPSLHVVRTYIPFIFSKIYTNDWRRGAIKWYGTLIVYTALDSLYFHDKYLQVLIFTIFVG